MKSSVLPADTFVVINKTMISDNDRQILIMLYQPIIGYSSISLYFTFCSYLDKAQLTSKDYTHHNLMTNMQLNLESISEAREKLEAVGLVKTYLKKTDVNNYIYQLYSPVSPNEFLNNPVLNTSLLSNLGNEEYKKIVDYYRTPTFNLTEYEDITQTFSQVFEVIPLKNYDNLISDLRKKSINNIHIEPKIDLNQILSLISSDYLNKRSISNTTRDLIYKLSFVYDLNNDNMIELIKNSIVDKKIDNNSLKTNCRNFYNFDNQFKKPTLVLKTQPEYLKTQLTSTDKRSKIIYAFETISPHDFLTSKNKGVKLNKSELEILDYLFIDLNLNPGVINVLIDYVLKINNNKLIKKFVETIALQWVRANIKTVEEAMNLAEEEYKKKKTVIKKTQKTVSKPSWINKEIEEKQATKEEQEEINEILNQFK